MALLTKRLFLHQTCCQFTRPTEPSQAWIASVLQKTTVPMLIQDLMTAKVDADSAQSLIDDLIFPGGGQRSDVRVYPIIRLGDYLYITPGLFLTADWETIVLRQWSQRHSGEYGARVASRKKRLARDFAALLDNGHDFHIRCDAPLYDDNRRQIGDVDVAAYSPSEGYLALFEAKWLLPPDEAEEVIHSDTEILEGVEQVSRSTQFARTQTDRFFKQIFPTLKDAPESVEVKPYLVCQGHVPSTLAGVRSLMSILN